VKIDKRTSTVESEWAIFKTGYSTIQNIFEPKLAILDPSFACTRVPLDQTRRLGVWVATILSCLPALIRYTRIKRVATDRAGTATRTENMRDLELDGAAPETVNRTARKKGSLQCASIRKGDRPLVDDDWNRNECPVGLSAAKRLT
jgi:hypothetical protein